MRAPPPPPSAGGLLQQPELKLFVEFSLRNLAATRQAGHRFSEFSHPGKKARAVGASIKVSGRSASNFEREVVTTGFPGNAKVPASFLPGGSMRRNAPFAGASLRQEMRDLVPQSPINFFDSMLEQARVE
jgi:hypothetical protein